MRVLPLPVDNLERDVLVRRASLEDDGRNLGLVLVLDDPVRRSLLRVDEIRVEDATGVANEEGGELGRGGSKGEGNVLELVTLNDLGRGVVRVVVRLIVPGRDDRGASASRQEEGCLEGGWTYLFHSNPV